MSTIEPWLFTETTQAIFRKLSPRARLDFLERKFFPRLARFLYEVKGLTPAKAFRGDNKLAYTFSAGDPFRNPILIISDIYDTKPKAFSYCHITTAPNSHNITDKKHINQDTQLNPLFQKLVVELCELARPAPRF